MNKKFLTAIVIILIIITSVSIALYNVPSENHAPIALAVADSTCGKSPFTAQFKGLASDEDKDKILYKWDFGDGTYSNLQNPNHTYNHSGKFVVKLTVKDNSGATGNDSIMINVIDYYQPVAKASSDVTCGKASLKVNFNGHGYDLDGRIESYHWNFGDGSVSEERNPIHTFGEIGRYIVHLTVIDNDGQIGTDTMEINVIRNILPRAHASANMIEIIPLCPLIFQVNFNGRGEDIDGENLSYHWNFIGNTKPIIQNAESNEQNPKFYYFVEGVYTARLTVTDEDGASDTDTVEITIKRNKKTQSSDGSKSFLQEIILALIQNRNKINWGNVLISYFDCCTAFFKTLPSILHFIIVIIEKLEEYFIQGSSYNL